MNARFLALVALLLLPTACAAPDGAELTKETDTVIHSDEALTAFERLDFKVTDAARYGNGTWEVWVVSTAPKPTAQVSRNGSPVPVPAERINATAGAPTGFQAYGIAVGALHPNPQSTDAFSLVISYPVAGLRYTHRVANAVPSLVVFAHPGAGKIAQAEGAPDFIRADDRSHTILTNVAQGTQFSVLFVNDPSPVPAVRNLSVYFWAIGGLIVGFLVSQYFAARAREGRKFEKGGTQESREFLEARRRALMAALKELEVAHEAKEIPDAAYAPLKEEYKAQAVRVLRTLEEKKEPQKP